MPSYKNVVLAGMRVHTRPTGIRRVPPIRWWWPYWLGCDVELRIDVDGPLQKETTYEATTEGTRGTYSMGSGVLTGNEKAIPLRNPSGDFRGGDNSVWLEIITEDGSGGGSGSQR